jgi:hypothetical protein
MVAALYFEKETRKKEKERVIALLKVYLLKYEV